MPEFLGLDEGSCGLGRGLEVWPEHNFGPPVVTLIGTPMKRSLISFCFLLVLHDAGLCQARKAKPAFYIALNSLTKTCTVVDRMPQADSPNTTLASDAIFETRAEAEAAIKTMKPCN
jgi:hypothetical protein